MAKQSIIPDVIAAASNRRSFVRKLGIASATAGAVYMVGSDKAGATTAHPNDTDILNFALNLEYLEAEFYTVATSGKYINESPYDIGISGTGWEGPTIGGKKVDLSDSVLFTSTVAQQIANDERDHVKLLRGALGSAAVAKPEINLDAAGFGFNNVKDFLKLARMFEDIGVTAYAGAAPLIASKAYLGVAARILAAEAEHVGNIRLQVARYGIATKPMDCVDIIPPPSGIEFFSLDPKTGLAAIRTPGQVLYLAYGNLANARSGGFFPKGANGYFVESSSSSA